MALSIEKDRESSQFSGNDDDDDKTYEVSDVELETTDSEEYNRATTSSKRPRKVQVNCR